MIRPLQCLPMLVLALAARADAARPFEEIELSGVVYDRGGYVYHGRVKALIDASREAGLNKGETAAEGNGAGTVENGNES